MPRTPSNISEERKSELRIRLASILDYEVRTNKDCVRLSQEIEAEVNKRISPSTLRRFFDIEIAHFNTSEYTIQVFEEFLLSRRSSSSSYRELKEFVLEIFSPVHFEDISVLDSAVHGIYRRVAMILRSNESLFSSVMIDLARSKTGRVFYYELFPDYEILSKFQYRGYEYYLNYSETPNDKVFALSLLAWSAKDRDSHSELEGYVGMLKSMKVDTDRLHPFVLGRYLSTLLRFTSSTAERNTILRGIEEQISVVQPDNSLPFGQFPGFHYFIADALIDVGEATILKRVLEDAHTRFPRILEFEWKGYYDQFELFAAWCYYLQGYRQKALSALARVDSRKFYFVSSAYFEGRKQQLQNLLLKHR